MILLGGAGILCAINGFAASMLTVFDSGGLIVAVLDLGSISPFVWFALYAVGRIALHDAAPIPATLEDRWLAGLAAIAALIPFDWVASFAVLGIGLRFVWVGRGDSAERRIGIILLALTGALIWGRLLLRLVMPSLLGLEAALVAMFAGTDAQGDLVAFSDGGRFVVGPGCSSLHGMSLALLFWASVGQLLNRPIGPRSLVVCLAGMAVMLAANLARLVAIARHPAEFDYYHGGVGGQIFAWSSLILCAIVILYGYARLGSAESDPAACGGARAHARS